MRGVIYSGPRVQFLKFAISFLVFFGFNTLAVQAQTTYLSTFENPAGKYNVDRPTCTLNLLPPTVSSPENISSATLTDYATLSTTIANATLVCNGSYLINANLNLGGGGITTIPASVSNPYYAGFKVRISSALLTNLIGGGNSGIVVRTLQDGVPVQTAGVSAIGLSLLQGGIPGNINFITTQPFNQVAVEISSGLLSLGLASTVDFFYAFASTAQIPVLLPVKLTSFSANAESKSVVINWTTVSEINVAKYELQRSSDGGNTFNTVTTITAKENTTTESRYSFTDGTALMGNYTYRLKIIDKDGGADYSRLALVKISTSANWKIYPTLLSSGTDLNVSVAAASSGKIQVQLANLQGQIVRTASAGAESKLIVSTGGLSAGVYVLKLYKDNLLQTSEKIVIQ